jgi:hypothetical protein
MTTDPDIELVRSLVHTIGVQADGTKEYERIWIAGAATLIDQLVSGGATDAARKRARAYLELAR